jgi:hypothetical protein
MNMIGMKACISSVQGLSMDSKGGSDALERRIGDAIRPYNHVGLFHPEACHLYRYKVAAK